jgi:hypothetical protein
LPAAARCPAACTCTPPQTYACRSMQRGCCAATGSCRRPAPPARPRLWLWSPAPARCACWWAAATTAPRSLTALCALPPRCFLATLHARDAFAASPVRLQVHASRPCGSVFKPAVFLAALEHRLITPASLLPDQPLRYARRAPKIPPPTFLSLFSRAPRTPVPGPRSATLDAAPAAALNTTPAAVPATHLPLQPAAPPASVRVPLNPAPQHSSSHAVALSLSRPERNGEWICTSTTCPLSHVSPPLSPPRRPRLRSQARAGAFFVEAAGGEFEVMKLSTRYRRHMRESAGAAAAAPLHVLRAPAAGTASIADALTHAWAQRDAPPFTRVNPRMRSAAAALAAPQHAAARLAAHLPLPCPSSHDHAGAPVRRFYSFAELDSARQQAADAYQAYSPVQSGSSKALATPQHWQPLAVEALSLQHAQPEELLWGAQAVQGAAPRPHDSVTSSAALTGALESVASERSGTPWRPPRLPELPTFAAAVGRLPWNILHARRRPGGDDGTPISPRLHLEEKRNARTLPQASGRLQQHDSNIVMAATASLHGHQASARPWKVEQGTSPGKRRLEQRSARDDMHGTAPPATRASAPSGQRSAAHSAGDALMRSGSSTVRSGTARNSTWVRVDSSRLRHMASSSRKRRKLQPAGLPREQPPGLPVQSVLARANGSGKLDVTPLEPLANAHKGPVARMLSFLQQWRQPQSAHAGIRSSDLPAPQGVAASAQAATAPTLLAAAAGQDAQSSLGSALGHCSTPGSTRADGADAAPQPGGRHAPPLACRSAAGAAQAAPAVEYRILEEYLPMNVTSQFAGVVTARTALAQSLNAPTVALAYEVGLDNGALRGAHACAAQVCCRRHASRA